MRIENDVKLDYNNVLLRPKRSRLLSRSEVNLTRRFRFPNTTRSWEGVPIAAANMDVIGTLSVARILTGYKMLTCIHKHYNRGEWLRANLSTEEEKHVAISMGKAVTPDIAGIILDHPTIPFLCLDVANGYSQPFLDFVAQTRSMYPAHIIIAGNVATAEMTEALILHGADIVKVGIGPGAACSTRMVTGVGYPQLSAIMETADAAHGLDGHIMADGGCQMPGDVAKAFAAGADFVMLGSMLAGHDETGSEFYGMSSNKAQLKYGGELKDYRASEGLELTIENRGPLKNTIKQILGGLRSACTYIGAQELKHMPKCSTFVRTERQ